MQQIKLLRHEQAGKEAHARDVAARSAEAGDEAQLDRSLPLLKTIGIVVVTFFAASAAGVLPGVAITVTWRRIRSAASAGSRSY